MTDNTIEAPQNIDRPAPPGVAADGGPLQQHVGLPGSAHEGAELTSRELGMWRPAIRTPDAEINNEKPILDARGRDLIRNTGLMTGAVATHRDSIVGHHFRLNSRPRYKVLGLDAKWAEEFAAEVEEKFDLYAESENCWIDASRNNTLTGLVRMAVGMFFQGGEVLGTLEWMRGANRPYRTALQMVDPDRLCNPQGREDTDRIRRGIERDAYGAALAYHILRAHPTDVTRMQDANNWTRVPAFKPWGRPMVLHIIEQMRPDQTRGISAMVSVLKEMRMTKKFHDITLQNAVVNATFAAAIESELPPEQAFEMIGAVDPVSGEQTMMSGADALLAAIAQYTGGAKNLNIDGVKIPHLYPGSKLKLYPAGTPGGVGTDFEQSLLRYVASALGLSYEQFSRDYTKTNYSSARASMNETWKYMRSRKKIVADRTAQTIYACWLEEALNRGDIDSMPSNAPNFYDGLNRDAYCKASWIGAPRGQVDELKESQASALRMKIGVSTLEDESSSLGKDWREVLEQQARELALRKQLGLPDPDLSPTKEGTNSAQRSSNDDAADAGNTDNGDAE